MNTQTNTRAVERLDRGLVDAPGALDRVLTRRSIAEREGLPIIGACRTGVCGSCKCKVVDGEFETASTTPLTAEEKQELQALLRTKGQSNRLPPTK